MLLTEPKDFAFERLGFAALQGLAEHSPSEFALLLWPAAPLPLSELLLPVAVGQEDGITLEYFNLLLRIPEIFENTHHLQRFLVSRY